jgi:hypothetical protein
MATIKKIGIDHYSETPLTTGFFFSADIVMDGLTIGMLESKGEDGQIELTLHDQSKMEEFHARVNQYFTEHPATLHDAQGFILELIDLYGAEQEFISTSQQRATPFILVEAMSYSRTSTIEDIEDVNKTFYSVDTQEQLDSIIIRVKPVSFNVYRQLSDFNK